jgi:thiol-disulfide isomerase/thioredoxin
MKTMVIACLSFVLLTALPARSQERSSPVAVGRRAPLMAFTDRSGTSHKIAWDGNERANIFFFFEPFSQASILGLSFLESLSKITGPYGVRIFAIEGSGLDEEMYAKRMERYHRVYGEPSFPVILDPEYEMSKLFGIEVTPSAYLLQRHGVTLYVANDFYETIALDLASRVERLLGRKEGLLTPALKELGIERPSEKDQREEAASSEARRRRSTQLLKVGDKVDPFEFTDLEGKTHRLFWSAREKGLTIVFFWGSLCLPCIQEMAYLESIYQATEDFNVNIVAVEAAGLSSEETANVMKRLERFQARPSYIIATDAEKKIGTMFGGIQKIPQTFFISAEGKIIYHADEFIIEGAGNLARKIERAIGVDAGTIQGADAGAMVATLPPDPDAERDEIFRSNFSQAEYYFNAWDFDKALPYYLRCLDMQPDQAYLIEPIAEIYERQGKLEAAVLQWQEILRLEPGHNEAESRIRKLQALQDRGSTGETREGP